MVEMKVINPSQQRFLITADEAVRVEVSLVNGFVVAHVYSGTEIDIEQEPLGAFDGSLDNSEDWCI